MNEPIVRLHRAIESYACFVLSLPPGSCSPQAWGPTEVLAHLVYRSLVIEDTVFQDALDAAFQYLGTRPRSVWEVRQRLRRRGLDPELIERVVAWLLEHGFLDDEAFANFWIENRESFRPRGRRLLVQELRLRGVSPETLEPQLESLDEEDSAMRAARKKVHGLPKTDYRTFASKLGGFLQRRGFSYDVTSTVTRRLWAELTTGSPAGQGYGQEDEPLEE